MKLQKQIWSIFRFSFLVSMINCLLIGNLIAQSNPKGATIASTPDTSKAGNTWAVIVGISKYQNVQGLNYADKDALAFYDYLVNKKGIDSKHVQLLINEKAIASDIYGALDWLNLSIKENDRVIFYFSGHGDVETKTIYQNGFLLANDAPVAAYMTKGTINITFLQQYLETYIAKKAKDVILIVDACRSGKLAGGSQGIQITMHSLGQNWNNQIIKVLSAQEGESSFEDKKWGGGRGVFSYYLVKGLEGLANRNADSVITASELAAYLPFAVADATASVQNPTVTGSPKTNLFTFNKTLLALANQQDNQAETGAILASRGTNNELDPEIEKWYNQYKSYLQKGRLIWGAKQTDTINCAKYFYQKLVKDARAKTLLPSLKSSFVASLKRKTELKLDEYINSKNIQERFVDPENEAFKEMALAKSLIDSSYILYNYLSARLLFIEAYKTKDPKKAITLLKKVIKIEPDASYAYNDLGRRFQEFAPTVHYVSKVEDSAAYYLKKAIELSPTWYGAYITLGNYYDEKKDYENAVYYDEKAIGIDSLFFGGYMNLHYVYQKANGDKKADSLIRSIINKKNTQVGEGTQNEYYFQNLGYLYQLIKDHENAIKYLQKSLSFNNPNKEFSGTSLFFLAMEYEETKDFEQLIKTLKEKIDLEPGNPKITMILAFNITIKRIIKKH